MNSAYWFLKKKYWKYFGRKQSINYLENTIVEKVAHCQSYNSLEFMEAITSHFIKNPDPHVVPVYSFNIWRRDKANENYIYSYNMMRLKKISYNEKLLIDLVGNYYDKYGAGACLQNVSYYNAQERLPLLFNFLKTITMQDRYYDIHSENIMTDNDGNYRLIDLEGFIKTPLAQDKNNWIKRD
jgi:hypothetical protein